MCQTQETTFVYYSMNRRTLVFFAFHFYVQISPRHMFADRLDAVLRTVTYKLLLCACKMTRWLHPKKELPRRWPSIDT
jgi:hypothetical protein